MIYNNEMNANADVDDGKTNSDIDQNDDNDNDNNKLDDLNKELLKIEKVPEDKEEEKECDKTKSDIDKEYD